LCGIICFFDCTHVANKDKLSLCPLMFTLSITPHHLWNQPFAWRPVGYFLKLPSAKTVGQNIDTLHHFLDVSSSGLVKAQQDGGLKSPILSKDGQPFRLCFKVPLCYVIGSGEGHNDLCAQYGPRQIYRLNQECNCLTESADNPDVKCTNIKASFLTQLCLRNDNETLKSLSFHNVTNAFDKVCFGANEYKFDCSHSSGSMHVPCSGN
jgi:hypothetical protein